MKKFNEDETKKIIDMYLETKDIEKMMDVFDCDEHDLRVVLKENKVDRNRNHFSKELYQRIKYLYTRDDKHPKDVCYDIIIKNCALNIIVDRMGLKRKGKKIYYRNSHYFDNIDTPNKAYILGLIYADGCNDVKRHHLTISLQERDKLILESIKKELEYEGPLLFNPIHERNSKRMNVYSLSIADVQISEQLNEKGVFQAKSLILKFPDCVPNELLRHFVRGYFDGDGCVYTSSDCYGNIYYRTEVVGTYDFCCKLSGILKSFGCNNSFKHIKGKHENTYRLRTSANRSTYKFLHWMYDSADLKLNRKNKKYLDLCNSYQFSHINLNQSNELIK